MADRISVRKFSGLCRRYCTWFRQSNGATWETQKRWLDDEFAILGIPESQRNDVWHTWGVVENYRCHCQHKVTPAEQMETLRFLLT